MNQLKIIKLLTATSIILLGVILTTPVQAAIDATAYGFGKPVLTYGPENRLIHITHDADTGNVIIPDKIEIWFSNTFTGNLVKYWSCENNCPSQVDIIDIPSGIPLTINNYITKAGYSFAVSPGGVRTNDSTGFTGNSVYTIDAYITKSGVAPRVTVSEPKSIWYSYLPDIQTSPTYPAFADTGNTSPIPNQTWLRITTPNSTTETYAGPFTGPYPKTLIAPPLSNWASESDGMKIFDIQVKDDQGYFSSFARGYFGIDRTPPTVTLNVSTSCYAYVNYSDSTSGIKDGEMDYSDDNGVTWKRLYTGLTTNAVWLPSCVEGKQYIVRFRAVDNSIDKNGQYSNWSNFVYQTLTYTPPPTPPPITFILWATNYPSCFGYHTGGALTTLSWYIGDTTIAPITWVDISEDINFTTAYHKYVGGTTATTAPEGFNGYKGVSGPLTFSPYVRYYIRFYNDTSYTFPTYYLNGGIECPIASAPGCPIENSQPVAYWKLDDTGSTAIDSTGHGFNGTFIGSVTKGITGAIPGSNAVQFDGITSYLKLPEIYQSDFNPSGAASFTLEGWTYLNNTASGNNLLYGRQDNIRLIITPSGFYADTGWSSQADRPIVQATTDSNVGKWVHWALVKNDQYFTVYRNGEIAGSVLMINGWSGQWLRLSGDIAAQTSPPPISMYLKGYIDDIAIYPKALDQGTLQCHFHQMPVSGTTPDLTPTPIPTSTPMLPWFKTSVGDVHSNDKIHVPGGP